LEAAFDKGRNMLRNQLLKLKDYESFLEPETTSDKGRKMLRNPFLK
jgi:hypothetical protein